MLMVDSSVFILLKTEGQYRLIGSLYLSFLDSIQELQLSSCLACAIVGILVHVVTVAALFLEARAQLA